ncbi:MAG: hypothetical protein K2H72_05970 [Muribaculaceae bacterium]|nr:hypothetical protein [Muribaculaceae bacterium]
MKKIFIAAVFAVAFSAASFAQQPVAPATEETETEVVDSLSILRQQISDINARLTEQEEFNLRMQQEQKWQGIWKRGKYTSIFYAPSASCTELGVKSKSDWTFGLNKGTTYLFPSRPIAGILKVGFDVRWFDISVTRYKKNYYELDGSQDSGWDNDYDDDWDDDFLPNIGRYDIHIGAFGIGPAVSVAPFSRFDNEARFIRATLYFHYQPTFGVHLLSEDGEMESSTAYCNMMDFGGKIQYRRFAIGVEGKWGSGNYSNLVSSDDFNDDYESAESSGKLKRKFSSTRLFISFSF